MSVARTEDWTHSLATSTYKTYGSKLKRFVAFCSSKGLCAIPAAVTTLELYVGHLLPESTVSMQYHLGMWSNCLPVIARVTGSNPVEGGCALWPLTARGEDFSRSLSPSSEASGFLPQASPCLC